jgi:hypothetical protein
MLQRGTREYTMWAIGTAAVVLAALFPVLWLLTLSFRRPRRSATGA